MNFKFSISALIACAYFLTLFIVKVIQTHDILGTLLTASIYSVLLFIAINILLQYVDYSFENLKRKESQDALEQIAKIEKEFKIKQKRELDDRLQELIEKDSNKDPFENFRKIDYTSANEDNRHDNNYNNEYDDKDEEDEIKKLKRDSGTQFDSRFIEHGGPNI